jgi:hypothetical protein
LLVRAALAVYGTARNNVLMAAMHLLCYARQGCIMRRVRKPEPFAPCS